MLPSRYNNLFFLLLNIPLHWTDTDIVFFLCVDCFAGTALKLVGILSNFIVCVIWDVVVDVEVVL